jgi:23S rRNA (pseudouridine1915-N3)-methyltransferase
MRELTLLAVGKLRDSGLRALCDDYYARCRRRFRVVERELRDLSALREAVPKRRQLVLLDERGAQHDSRAFAKQLGRWLGGPHPLLFGIGGADGFGDLRQEADALLSLGSMTFAHRLVRVLFAEQLYRAVSILDGSPYHRD